MKPRQNLYLDAALSKELGALAAKPGTSKSAIISDALRFYIDQRGTKGIDEKLKVRLDRLTNQLNRIERDQHIVVESLALFVRYYLSTVPPLPQSEQAAAQALGRDRFHGFIEQVGRRVAQGKSVAREIAERSLDERAASPESSRMAAE